MIIKTELNEGFRLAMLLIIICTLYTLMSYFTPLAYDDLIFMSVWNKVNGNSSITLSNLYDFWKEIRLYDNGRLANTVAPLSTLFSPWKEVFPYLTGLSVAVIVYFTTVLSFSKDKVSSFYLSIVWLCLIFLLPWRNALFVADYSLNYIWAAAITLIFMVVVMRLERTGWNIHNFILTLMLAFLAGGWHEGFAIPTLFGFLLLTIKKRFRFSKFWFATGLFYAAIAFLFLYCPGLLERSQRQLGVANTGQSYFKMIMDFLPVIFLILTGFASAVVPSLRKYLKKAWDNPWFAIGAGIIVAGTLLSLLFTHQPRSAFWPDLLAIVMILILTGPIWNRINRSHFVGYVTLVALAVCFVPVITAITWQYRLFRESEVIMRKIEESDYGTVYHDIIQGSEIPIAALKMTNHPAWVTDFHFHALKEFTGKPYPAVLPSELETANLAAGGKTLPGNTGAFVVKNSIIIPANPFGGPKTVEVDVQLTDGQKIPAIALLLPFITHDNVEMSYMVIYGIPVEDIEEISL